MEVQSSTIINKIEITKLKELRDIITELDVCEQSEILKIIDKNKIKFTENKNGVFINMNKLTNKSIEDIENFLSYIKSNYKKNLI
jgi:hypothetical protein